MAAHSLLAVNLSLASACGGDCIFCPSDRGKRIATKIMPMDVAEKIIAEITRPDFVRTFSTQFMNIGENGDAFINPNALDILRLAKALNPGMKRVVYTNFQTFSDDDIDAAVEEGLLDCVNMNLDGATNESFSAAKRMDIDHALRGIRTLVSARKRHGKVIPLTVTCLTAHRYVSAVMEAFGRPPVKMTAPFQVPGDDYADVVRLVAPLLGPMDEITRSPIWLWAERAQADPSKEDYSGRTCPNLGRVTNQAFIAPDGTWYACCLDSDNRLALGNVRETSIAEIARSQTRTTLIEKLRMRRFRDIGPPCDTVSCCISAPPES